MSLIHQNSASFWSPPQQQTTTAAAAAKAKPHPQQTNACAAGAGDSAAVSVASFRNSPSSAADQLATTASLHRPHAVDLCGGKPLTSEESADQSQGAVQNNMMNNSQPLPPQTTCLDTVLKQKGTAAAENNNTIVAHSHPDSTGADRQQQQQQQQQCRRNDDCCQNMAARHNGQPKGDESPSRPAQQQSPSPSSAFRSTTRSASSSPTDEHDHDSCDSSSSEAEASPVRVAMRDRDCCIPSSSCLAIRHAVVQLFNDDDFDRVEFLGDGFFSDVYKVVHRHTCNTYVLKIYKNEPSTSYSTGQNQVDSAETNDSKQQSNRRLAHKRNILREIQLINRFSHQNVLRFLGVSVRQRADSWSIHSLTEFCDLGNLQRLIMDEQRAFGWRLRCALAADVARGMEYVHAHGYIHRDLTSMNVLLKRSGSGHVRAVVADFGLACRRPGSADEPPLPQVGTPYWMAPECLNEEHYDEKVDIFSFGVIVCQCIARIDADPECGFPRTAKFGLDYQLFAESLVPEHTPDDLLRLAFQCVMMDPVRRPSFAQALTSLVSIGLALQRYTTADSGCQRGQDMSVRSPDIHLARSRSDAGRLCRPSALECVSPVSVALHQPAEDDDDDSSACTTPVSSSVGGGDRSPDKQPPKRKMSAPSRVLLLGGAAQRKTTGDARTYTWLASTVAAEDPFYEPLSANPFLAKYRGGHKIGFMHYKTRSVSVPQKEDGDACDGVPSSSLAAAESGGHRTPFSMDALSQLLSSRPPSAAASPRATATADATGSSSKAAAAVVLASRPGSASVAAAAAEAPASNDGTSAAADAGPSPQSIIAALPPPLKRSTSLPSQDALCRFTRAEPVVDDDDTLLPTTSTPRVPGARRRTERRLAHVFADSDQQFAAKRYAGSGRRHMSLAAPSAAEEAGDNGTCGRHQLRAMATIDLSSGTVGLHNQTSPSLMLPTTESSSSHDDGITESPSHHDVDDSASSPSSVFGSRPTPATPAAIVADDSDGYESALESDGSDSLPAPIKVPLSFPVVDVQPMTTDDQKIVDNYPTSTILPTASDTRVRLPTDAACANNNKCLIL